MPGPMSDPLQEHDWALQVLKNTNTQDPAPDPLPDLVEENKMLKKMLRDLLSLDILPHVWAGEEEGRAEVFRAVLVRAP